MEGSAPSCGPPATGGPTRGCRCRSSAPARSDIGGVTPVEGLYVAGQRFQYRRDSNFIDGVRHDAAYLAGHIAAPHHRSPAAAGPSVRR